MPSTATRKDSKDRLERKSIIGYCDRLLNGVKGSNLDRMTARQAVLQVRTWARKWRPRADRVKGGRGK